jgi:DNA-binding NarL/FixJ family response regulator
MNDIRIAIADDHELFRMGLASVLGQEANFQVNLLASNGLELLEKLQETECDVLILDIEMPLMDGFKVLEKLAKRRSNIRVIILSMFTQQPFVIKAIKAGAHGFLPKNCHFDMACQAIRAVHSGGYFFDKQTSLQLAGVSNEFEEDEDKLTNRETDVIRLICKGYRNSAIASELCVSIRTVEKYRASIYLKIGKDNLVDIVLYAIKNGIVEL